MNVCLSPITALIFTIFWLAGISYLDYRVAIYRHHTRLSARLELERALHLPWNPAIWLVSGLALLFSTGIIGLIGLWAQCLLLLSAGGFVGALTLKDWSHLQQVWTYRPLQEGWLIGLRGEYAGLPIHLDSQEWSIGRDRINQLVSSDANVSRRHAVIQVLDGRFWLKDFGSKQGTYLNGRPVTQSILKEGDQITIGGNLFVFQHIPQFPEALLEPEGNLKQTFRLEGLSGEFAARIIYLDHTDVTIGRSKDNTIVLNDSTVSRQHARIRYAKQNWYIQDQNSLSGTYVNGTKVSAIVLHYGDQISIGSAEFRFLADNEQGPW